jgi:ABC-type dipeptide/oligopeptide/nickel transport system ATPase component
MADTILTINNLHVYFYTFEGVIKTVEGVSFSIEPGQVLGLVGKSGSGKSVLGRAILNQVDPPGKIVGGEILFKGEDLLKKSEEEMAALSGTDIAMIVPGSAAALNPLYRAGEQISNMYRYLHGMSKKEAHKQALKMLERVRIADPERTAAAYPHELSGGMAQRVVIAIALTASPSLFIADEPTFGLDVTIQRQVLDLMDELILNTASATLLISRDLGIVANYCDTVAVLHEGKIIELADVESFFARPKGEFSQELLRAADPSRTF